MMFTPSPPGDTIRDIIDEKGISRDKLAHMLGASKHQIEMLLDGRYCIDNDMASRLADKLGSTVTFWENREKQYRESLVNNPQYCTEFCSDCRLVSLANGNDVYICLLDTVEVIPAEIDLTTGYGQTAPDTNTGCQYKSQKEDPEKEADPVGDAE